MNERETLLNRVRMHDLALVDAGLFLDGHPHSSDALSYFRRQQAAYKQAVQNYEAKYGPLMFKNGDFTNGWSWVNDPWQWEGADN